VLRILLLTGMISQCPVFTSVHDAVNDADEAPSARTAS
jgi:hypothetical protein